MYTKLSKILTNTLNVFWVGTFYIFFYVKKMCIHLMALAVIVILLKYTIFLKKFAKK